MNKALLLLFLLAFNCLALAQTKAKTDSIYTYAEPTPDGTGKYYLGREIAHVMSFEGADWLERDTRQKEENTALSIAKLPIAKTSVVADIGAGTGYYTFRIAPKVPEGKVFAVEIQDDALAYLKKKSKELKLDNITVVKGGEKSPNLPDNSVDLAIMVDVYHELSYPHEMLQAIRKALKPGGKLLLIEYRGEDPNVPIKELHKTTIAQVSKEMKANGYHLAQDGEFLTIQHFLVFRKDQ